MTRHLLLVAMLGFPLTAQAQEPRPAPEGLDLRALPTGFVLDDQGVETTGKLLKLDRDGVVLVIDGAERRFDLARVKRVSRRGDSLKNGVIAGTIVGAALSGLAVGNIECRDGARYTTCSAGRRVGFFVAGVGIYTLIGTGIDAAIQGRTVLYRAPAVGVSAAARPGGGAVSLSVRW
jgi:hypothetical protein